jgi:hypothetical protein
VTRFDVGIRERLQWLRALREPERVRAWSLPEWERVVRVARAHRLLARLAVAIEQAGLLGTVPPEPRRLLLSSQRISRWRTSQMVWALERVRAALDGLAGPRVLLKGAAYVAQALPIAAGRLPSDADILIPKADLDAAVARLAAAGWAEAQLDEHDRRYYVEWSHEVPPMTHPLHGIELDVHHNILPPVARIQVDASALLARVQASGWAGWQVLSPADQVLHCASHLFLDSEARVRLRDLVDLDGLMRHFGSTPAFWDELPIRADALGLAEPLALALHFCANWLDTPVPTGAAASESLVAARGPASVWLRALWARSLAPVEPDASAPWGQDAAAFILLARYHHRRMPLRLLVPHTWHKLRGRWRGVPQEGAKEGAKEGRPG